MTDLEPSQRIPLHPKPLEDRSPKVYKSIVEDGILTAYDSVMQPLFSFDFDSPDMGNLVDSIVAIAEGPAQLIVNENSPCPDSPSEFTSVHYIIESFEEAGAIVTEHQDGLVTIRYNAGLFGFGSQPGDIVVLLVNTTTDKVIGFTLYDSSEGFKSSFLYHYDNSSPYFVKMIQTVNAIQLPSGKMAEEITEISLNDLEIQFDIE